MTKLFFHTYDTNVQPKLYRNVFPSLPNELIQKNGHILKEYVYKDFLVILNQRAILEAATML